MGTFYALLAFCAGNSLVPDEFLAQRPVTRSFDVFFDLRQNKWLSEQSWGWWFGTLSRQLWRHRNVEYGRLFALRSLVCHCAVGCMLAWFCALISWKGALGTRILKCCFLLISLSDTRLIHFLSEYSQIEDIILRIEWKFDSPALQQ